jgi:uncharacterized OsmC-like protein
MPDIIYISRSRIERKVGPVHIAHLPAEPQEVVFSAHGPLAQHYKIEPVKLIGSHASTLDYVVAATAGGMLGTFGVALEARHINASNGKLIGDVTGEVGSEDGILVIRRIHLAMRLEAPEEARPVVARVHSLYPMKCPLYRTLHKAIDLSSSYELVPR